MTTTAPRHRGSADWVGAVEQSSRRRVQLVLLPDLTPDERDRVEQVLDAYAQVRDDNLAAPVSLADQADVLVVPAAEPTRTVGLQRRLRTAGQAVTVLVPVASALAALHESGLAHGDVDLDAVEIDAAGRPRLTGAGVAAALHALAPREVPEPTVDGDRSHLVSLLSSVSRDVDDLRLAELAADLDERQADAATVAATLLDAVQPTPLSGPSESPETSGAALPGARGRVRPLWLVAGVLVVAVAALAVWLLVGRDGGPVVADSPVVPTALPTAEVTQAPSSTPGSIPGASAQPSGDASATTGEAAPAPGIELCGPPAPAPDMLPELVDDWTTVVDELYLRRSAALVTGQTRLLCDVYDPLSAGLASDIELDAAYEQQGVRPDALVFVVAQATLVEQQSGLLVVEVTDQLEPYRLLDADGTVVAELPGIPSETWQARLVPDASGTQWRFG